MGDQTGQVGCISGQGVHDALEKAGAGLRPARPMLVGRVLHDGREHVLAVGREARVFNRGDSDLEHGMGRVLAVLGVIEGPLHIGQIRRDHQPLRQRRGCQMGKGGQTIQRQVQLGGVASHAHVMDLVGKARLNLSRADQVQERGLGIGVGNHGAGRQGLTVAEHHPRCPPGLDHNPRYGCSGAHISAGVLGGRGERGADATHAAGGQGSPAAPAEPMQGSEHAVIGAGAQVTAEHRIQSKRALQQRVLQTLLQHVEDVDAGDAQKLSHVLATQQPDIQPHPADTQQVRPVATPQARRSAAIELRQQRGKPGHPVAVRPKRRLIGAGQHGAVHPVVANGEVLAILGQGDGTQILFHQAQTMTSQIELTGHPWIQTPQQMGTGRHLESGGELAGPGSTADRFCRLQHQDLFPGPGQIGRAHQAVVSSADDNDALSHRATLPARYWAGAGP